MRTTPPFSIKHLSEICQNLHTQDNRATEAPIFIVQQNKPIYGLSPEYTDKGIWLYDGEECEDEKNEKLEEQWQKDRTHPSGYERVGFVDHWEFVTACFTEQGCLDFLAIEGHNLNEPRIYAAGSYRNQEWRTVRDFLLGKF